MTRQPDWDIFGNETPTEIHHKDCENAPDSHPTGGAAAALVLAFEDVDRSCSCLTPLFDSDRDDGRKEPTRSEPADFGHGESTGVQDL